MVRFTIDLTDELNASIDGSAKAAGLSRSSYIRQAVELMNWVVRNKNKQLIVRDSVTNDSHILLIPGIVTP